MTILHFGIQMSVRVLLADDHTIVRQAIKAALAQEGFEVVGEASDGREAINHCRHLQPEVAVVHGYVLKADTAAELARAIYAVCKGQTYISPAVYPALKACQIGTEPAVPLSVRECEVLQLIAEGNSTKEIADILKMSYKTVRSHRDNIMKKLDVHSTVDLVLYSIRRGLLEA